jgi:hypothetical protein
MLEIELNAAAIAGLESQLREHLTQQQALLQVRAVGAAAPQLLLPCA